MSGRATDPSRFQDAPASGVACTDPGTDWGAALAGRNLIPSTYDNPSLDPGECLPQSVWEIEVVSEEEWPHDSNRVENRKQLSTARERVDEDCIEHEVE